MPFRLLKPLATFHSPFYRITAYTNKIRIEHRRAGHLHAMRARQYGYRDSMLKMLTRLIALLVLAPLMACDPAQSQDGNAQAAVRTGSNSGLRIPRFVSLKSSQVNVRKGPSLEYPVAWEYKRVGLPVEIVAESDNWRRVRDSEGSEGWIFHSLLSGRRTALVSPWSKAGKSIPLLSRPSRSGGVVAQLEPGVLGSILTCDGKWCNFSLDRVSGWIEQVDLWGVYPNEQIE